MTDGMPYRFNQEGLHDTFNDNSYNPMQGYQCIKKFYVST